MKELTGVITRVGINDMESTGLLFGIESHLP